MGQRIVFEILIALIWFSFAFFWPIQGCRLLVFVFKSGQLSPAMRVPMGYAYASVPVGGLLMTIHLIEDLATLVRKYRQGEDF